MVVGDSYKITQLLYNLVTNAAKFTVAGSIQICAREDQGRGMLELDVADTGKGIEPEALKRIFEPFQQTENKDSRSFQGIGLGLSVAMSIARLHGGEIRVASKGGQGSTFTVVLPCDFNRRAGLTIRADDGSAAKIHALKHVAAQAKSGPPRGGVATPAGQRPLALSVDDDDINQEVIEQTLGSEFRIVRAMNGMEAFAYLDSGKEFPSLMLLDVMMPGLTGFQVVKEIRDKRNLSHTQLPVVMLSARSPQEATANEAFDSGATDYMQKPFSATVLKHRLTVIHEVRQEIRKAELGAVETYKQEAENEAKEQKQVSDPQQAAPQPPKAEKKQDLEKEKARHEEERKEREEQEAARAEAIGKLERERDQLKARLEARQAEAAEAGEALRRLEGERDRLKADIAAVAMAPEAAKLPARLEGEPGKAEGAASATPSARLGLCDGDLDAAESKAAFYREEMELRDRQIHELREKLDRNKCEAYLQRQRADAIDRELRFVRQLRSRIFADAPMA